MKNHIFPADIQTLSNREFDDILYLFLQCISTEKGEIPEFKKTTLVEALNISFTTFSKKFKWIQNNLCTDGVLKQNFPRFIAIPERTLRCLLVYNGSRRNTLKIYIYLLSKFYMNHQCPTTFSLKELVKAIGYSSSAVNNRKVKESLNVLEELNLIAPVYKEPKSTNGNLFSCEHTLLMATTTANTTSTFDENFKQRLESFGIKM